MESKNIKDVDFSKMAVIEIKKFLTERGVSVNGYHKPSLIEIVNSVQKMKLPSVESLLCKNYNELQRDGKLWINLIDKLHLSSFLSVVCAFDLTYASSIISQIFAYTLHIHKQLLIYMSNLPFLY